ncbi:hypothetical protein [Gordonia sp. SND2]|uniref:hypothetical protein n=1 Tax=Gordonia sp. SND2 TaxID=3388659 RepID=UPI00398AC38E
MTAADMIPVRPTGVVASHMIHGVGRCEHIEYTDDDGARVIVSEFPERNNYARVTWWTPDGRRQEAQERGSHRWLLAVAGFALQGS